MNTKDSQLNIGDKIHIVRKRRDMSIMYPSQILDIIDDNTYIISGPITQSTIVSVFISEKIEIIYIIKDKGRYKFDAIVLKKDEKNVYRLYIKKISETKRIQQRKFYRFSENLPVKKIFNLQMGKKQKTIEEKCLTRDISGSGMMLLSNYKHSIKDIVECYFEINNKMIHIKGQIVRIDELKESTFKYALGIYFSDIKKKDREDIIKYIFEKERIMIEKGLI